MILGARGPLTVQTVVHEVRHVRVHLLRSYSYS
jgi:hypothetical protein